MSYTPTNVILGGGGYNQGFPVLMNLNAVFASGKWSGSGSARLPNGQIAWTVYSVSDVTIDSKGTAHLEIILVATYTPTSGSAEHVMCFMPIAIAPGVPGTVTLTVNLYRAGFTIQQNIAQPGAVVNTGLVGGTTLTSGGVTVIPAP